MSAYDPRDYCETPDELAREVLDREEYGTWLDERRNPSRGSWRITRRQPAEVDPWSAA